MLLTSCNDFYFKNPQPQNGKELSSIPDQLIGTYMEIHENDSNDRDYGDTIVIIYSIGPLVITPDSFHMDYSGHVFDNNKVEGSLESGKVILKKMDDFYVLSQKIRNPLNSAHDSVWEVYIVKYKNNLLTLYTLTSNDSNLKVDSITQITPVKEFQEEDARYYLINPSNKQFKKLLTDNLYEIVGEFEKVE